MSELLCRILAENGDNACIVSICYDFLRVNDLGVYFVCDTCKHHEDVFSESRFQHGKIIVCEISP